MKGQGLAIAAIAGLGLYLWQKGKTAQATTTTKETSQVAKQVAEVKEVLASGGAKLVQAYTDYAGALPSASNAVQQAVVQIAGGTATIEDVLRFNAELTAYATYTKDGGKLSYEDFAITMASQMEPKYAAIVQAGKDAAISAQVDETVASFSSQANLANYVNMLQDNTPLKNELLSRPEVKAALAQTKQVVQQVVVEPAISAQQAQPTPVATLAIEETKSYEQVATQAAQSGGYVSWSSSGGYEVISAEQVASPEYW